MLHIDRFPQVPPGPGYPLDPIGSPIYPPTTNQDVDFNAYLDSPASGIPSGAAVGPSTFPFGNPVNGLNTFTPQPQVDYIQFKNTGEYLGVTEQANSKNIQPAVWTDGKVFFFSVREPEH